MDLKSFPDLVSGFRLSWTLLECEMLLVSKRNKKILCSEGVVIFRPKGSPKNIAGKKTKVLIN